MKKIWLVRHCESISNAGQTTFDPVSIPLTPLGWQQSQILLDSFEVTPNLIVTSPFIRTQQTAVNVRNKFPEVLHEEWPVQEFSYLSFKRYANTNSNERKPAVKEYWDRCDPKYCDGDGAESFCDLIDRIDATIEKIKERSEAFVVIFTHGQFMKVFWWYLKNSEVNFRTESIRMKHVENFINRIDIDNGAILKLKLFGNNKWDIQLQGLHADNLR